MKKNESKYIDFPLMKDASIQGHPNGFSLMVHCNVIYKIISTNTIKARLNYILQT